MACVILTRFQIPDQDSDSMQVQNGYVVKRAQKSRCEEIGGEDIRKFPRLIKFVRIYSKDKIPDSKFQGKILDSI